MSYSLKDYINKEFVELVAETLSSYTKFDQKSFLKNTTGSSQHWNSLELKQRIRHLSHEIHQGLREDFTKNILVIRKTSEALHKKKVNGLGLFLFPDYVEVFGLNHWDISMEALEHLTQHSTGEFAIRPFLKQNFEKTLKQMKDWSHSNNYHVRRFSSEGTRPKLPWGQAVPQLTQNIHTLEILENLKNDKELYVRKSVANHLNDISKKYPNEILQLAKKWYGKNENQNWVVKHALRSLLKASHPQALELFGYNTKSNSIKLTSLKADKTVKEGKDLSFSFLLNVSKPQKVRIEFAMYFLRQNKTHSKKVFMISEKTLQKGKYSFSKKYSFKKITTRKYYPGLHKLAILVNGQELAKANFNLQRCAPIFR